MAADTPKQSSPAMAKWPYFAVRLGLLKSESDVPPIKSNARKAMLKQVNDQMHRLLVKKVGGFYSVKQFEQAVDNI